MTNTNRTTLKKRKESKPSFKKSRNGGYSDRSQGRYGSASTYSRQPKNYHPLLSTRRGGRYLQEPEPSHDQNIELRDRKLPVAGITSDSKIRDMVEQNPS